MTIYTGEKTIDSVLFDLDGTLWDPTEMVCKAWNEVLINHGIEISSDEMRAVLGLQMPEISKKLFPQLDEKPAFEIMLKCCENECALIRREGGKLYPGVEKILQELLPKLKLFVVSNCQPGYIEAFFEYYVLSKYFTDYMSSGHDRGTKGEHISMIIDRNNLKNPVYVGDTEIDREAAREAGIPFIFAEYGFGRVKDYDAVVESISELPAVLLGRRL
jgi:phosphoglycolate phosphatase